MTEEIKPIELADDALESVSGGQDVQEGWKAVEPAGSCGSWEEKVNQGMRICAYCKHYAFASGKFYCTLGS